MRTRIWLAVGVTLIVATTASAQVTIMAGNATYTQFALPTTETSTAGTSDLRPEGGTTTDHLFQNMWYYRVAGDTREHPIGNYTLAGGQTITAVGSGGGTNQFSYAITETRFTAQWVGTLFDSTDPGNSTLYQSFSITNPGGSPLSIALFSYADFDVNGTAGGDSATGGIPEMTITDSVAGTALYGGLAANAFQVTAFATLRGLLLNASVDDFNNTGLPFGPGDFTGGFQWNLVIPAGGTVSVDGYLSVGPLVPIPEPTSLALTGLGILGVIRYRRRMKAA
jgi:hypothetical protein